jgi:hypothetical protein
MLYDVPNWRVAVHRSAETSKGRPWRLGVMRKDSSLVGLFDSDGVRPGKFPLPV